MMEERSISIYWAVARDAVKCAMKHRTVPTTKNSGMGYVMKYIV